MLKHPNFLEKEEMLQQNGGFPVWCLGSAKRMEGRQLRVRTSALWALFAARQYQFLRPKKKGKASSLIVQRQTGQSPLEVYFVSATF